MSPMSRADADALEHEDEDIFIECVICHGSMGRARATRGSRRCKHNSCKTELARRLRRDVAEPAGQPLAKSAPTSCYQVRRVLGVSLSMTSIMSDYEKRAGPRELHDEDICYEVCGGFGEDADDEFIPDTRWVDLTTMVDNMEENALSALDKFSSKVHKTLQSARKRLQERKRRRDNDLCSAGTDD